MRTGFGFHDLRNRDGGQVIFTEDPEWETKLPVEHIRKDGWVVIVIAVPGQRPSGRDNPTASKRGSARPTLTSGRAKDRVPVVSS